MVLYHNKAECCGCGACVDACKYNAISMYPDEYGFMLPNVKETICVKCGKCLKVCPLKQQELPVSKKECYAAVSDNEVEMLRSSSGGIFPVIGNEFIKSNGIVVGAIYDRDIQGKIYVRHECAEHESELHPMQNSKYLQSYTVGIYNTVKMYLDKGRKVLFTGTPCQIAGLKSYLQKEYDDLFTIETICHGVPSTKMFQSYIDFLEKKLCGKIEAICFRDKSKGWGKIPKVMYVDRHGKKRTKVMQYYKSSYFMLFLRGDILRDSCHSCMFASVRRAADISLGDYWGVEWEHPEFLSKRGGPADYNKGISCVIANTDKGSELIKILKQKVIIKPSSYDKIAPHNKQILFPLPYGENREKVLKAFLSRGYSVIDKMAFDQYRAYYRNARIRIAVTTQLKNTPGIKVIYAALKKRKDYGKPKQES